MMDDDFLGRHKEAFIREASTYVSAMNAALVKLEKKPSNIKLFHEIYRAAHTFKSIAATMNYNQSAQLCHAIEDLLEAVRNKIVSINTCADTLFECFDFLSESLKALASDQAEPNAQLLIQEVKKLWDKNLAPEKINPLEKDVSSVAIPKLQFIEVKVDRLDALMKLSEELLVSRMKLDLLRETINHPELTATIDTLGRLISEIQYNIMQVRLVPIGFIFNRFPRMVRDLAKQQQKEIDLKIEGADIELDRSLIDEIGESLTHLIRNAIDHGLETPGVRKKVNKPAQGTLKLIAKRTKEFVTIEISDDGSGLNLPEIKKVAMKENILAANASDEEVVDSIFKGISTTRHVTAVSGRGLGLSIVRQKIESIGGSMHVESDTGKGVSFFIKIPLTLAVIKVLFAKIGKQTYAIPLNNIERLIMSSEEDLKGMLSYDAIIFDGEDIPVTHLATLFGVNSHADKRCPIIVVQSGNERIGLVVDELLSTQDIVIKPLDKLLKENKYFSGSALIGSGEMILILDIDHIFLSGRRQNEGELFNAI